MTTKERILDEALTLFAEKGYDGTSMDLIAERVGIKGPSLYKHYKGKEEILNVLIDAEFVQVTMGKILFTMRDPMIRRIRMFLVQEQFRNDRLAEITTRHQLYGVQRMYARIIEAMMNKGLFNKKDDPEMLAVELTAPAVLLIAGADRQPQCEKEILDSMEKHIRHFCAVYMKA